jgi:hypothetical protein
MKQAGTLKQDIIISLDNLPPEGLKEVQNFLDFIRFKSQKKAKKSTPYIPVALGGLWEGEEISEQDIADIRKEMLGNLAKRDL